MIVKISDLGDIVTGKTPPTKEELNFGYEFPFITPGDLQSTKHILHTERALSQSGAQLVKNCILPPNSICVSCIGNFGYTGMTTKCSVTNQQINSIVVNSGHDSDFVYYLMKSLWPLFKHLEGQSTTLSILNKTLFSNIEVDIPELAAQRAIAATLSCLDDKIELNTRIIANLEAQAQAIFKSWFVDFEPFQDGEFEDSELGMIPKGWRVGTLEDICHYSNDRVAVETLSVDTYLSTENMLPNKQGFTIASSLPSAAYTTAYHVGNILISNIRPYFKKIVYCYGEGGCSTDVICFVANDGISTEYLFHLLYSDTFFDFMVGGSKGTKMPRGDKQQLMQYPVVLPEPKLLEEFREIAQPMLAQGHLLKQENEHLAQTRDALLPKLMSGEIEVPVEG